METMDFKYTCFIFSLVVTVCSAFLGPCHLSAMEPPADNVVHGRTVDPSCTTGTIDWHYPSGQFYVNFHPSAPSSGVCITKGIGPPSTGVYNVLPAGNERIDNPTEVHETCVTLVDGKAKLMFDKTSFLTYMTAYHYRITK